MNRLMCTKKCNFPLFHAEVKVVQLKSGFVCNFGRLRDLSDVLSICIANHSTTTMRLLYLYRLQVKCLHVGLCASWIASGITCSRRVIITYSTVHSLRLIRLVILYALSLMNVSPSVSKSSSVQICCVCIRELNNNLVY